MPFASTGNKGKREQLANPTIADCYNDRLDAINEGAGLAA